MATPGEKQESASISIAQERPLRENAQDVEETGETPYSTAWYYKSRNIGPIHIPEYASPQIQLGLVALTCFMCPGMFNALVGLGGAGQFTATVADNANVALYSTFSVVGFFAGSFANRLGLKLTLSFGGLGYFLYVASFLSYNHNANSGFVYFAGAFLGVCAGLLWTAQGAIMMSYPPEGSKGRYIAWFWMIFNLGAVIGGLIPLGENIHSKAGNVTDGTYIGFMVLTFIGLCLAWCLVDAHKVRRADGSHVILMKHPSWRSELLGLWEVLQTDSYIILLFPMFFASNWFYTYHFQVVNLPKFDVRTRALNSVLYYISQIIGAFVFGYAFDIKFLRRTTKAKAALASLFALTMAIWGGGYAWQKQYTRSETSDPAYQKLDWTSDGYVGPMFLFMFYGFYDAVWQTSVYWFVTNLLYRTLLDMLTLVTRLIGSLTNNGRKLANFAGFYKGIQSAGAAVSFRIDAQKAPFMNQFASNWGLLAGSLLLAAPIILFKVRDSVPLEDDLKFSDEAVEDVMPTTPPDIHEKH